MGAVTLAVDQVGTPTTPVGDERIRDVQTRHNRLDGMYYDHEQESVRVHAELRMKLSL
jgi:hypothetical protein